MVFKKKKDCSKSGLKTKIFHILLAMIIVFNLISPTIAYAAEANKVPAFFGNIHEVWVDDEGAKPRSSVKNGGFTYASAADLYGWTVNYPHYRGEVSRKNEDYYFNVNIKIDGVKASTGPRSAFWTADVDEDDVDTDLRAHCLANQMGVFAGFFRPIGSGLGNALRSLQVSLFHTLVEIKELDLTAILDLFTKKGSGGDSLMDKLTKILLRDPDTGELAPFMYIFLILWVLGMIGVTLKYIKGQGGFEVVKREIIFIVLSVVLFGVAITADGPKKISELSIKITDALNSAISDPATSDIFECEYDDARDQLVNSQTAIFAKANIDSSLCCIFVANNISDLDLTIPSDITDYAVVSNGNSTSTNVGYMLWAGQSTLDNREPIDSGNLKYIKGGDQNNIHWLIPDILQENGGMDDAKMVNYIDSLNSKTTFVYFSMSLWFMMVSIPFLITEVFAIFLVMVGKIILTISGFMLLVLPAFFLWERSRNLAVDICRCYIGSFIRVILGDMIFMIFLEMFSVMMQDSDPLSTIMALIIFWITALLMPTKVIPAINNMIAEVEGNGPLAATTRRYSDAALNKMSRVPGMAAAPAAAVIAAANAKRLARKKRKAEEEDGKSEEDEERKKRNSFAQVNRMSDDSTYDEDLNLNNNPDGEGFDEFSSGTDTEKDETFDEPIDGNKDSADGTPVPVVAQSDANVDVDDDNDGDEDDDENGAPGKNRKSKYSSDSGSGSDESKSGKRAGFSDAGNDDDSHDGEDFDNADAESNPGSSSHQASTSDGYEYGYSDDYFADGNGTQNTGSQNAGSQTGTPKKAPSKKPSSSGSAAATATAGVAAGVAASNATKTAPTSAPGAANNGGAGKKTIRINRPNQTQNGSTPTNPGSNSGSNGGSSSGSQVRQNATQSQSSQSSSSQTYPTQTRPQTRQSSQTGTQQRQSPQAGSQPRQSSQSGNQGGARQQSNQSGKPVSDNSGTSEPSQTRKPTRSDKKEDAKQRIRDAKSSRGGNIFDDQSGPDTSGKQDRSNKYSGDD